jgi:hypothetical protein
MSLLVNPRVIIISKKNEPSLNLLLTILKAHRIECHDLIHSRAILRELETNNFKGFLIFCIPPAEIKEWFDDLNEDFLNYFKIYNYNNLIEQNLDSSVFLMFDYIISGEQDYLFLSKQLDFLKSNYWRKIPYAKLGIRQLPKSKLIGNLFYIIERTDFDSINLDQLSKKLKVSNRVLRKEIKDHLNLQYSELKSTLLDHYREYSY